MIVVRSKAYRKTQRKINRVFPTTSSKPAEKKYTGLLRGVEFALELFAFLGAEIATAGTATFVGIGVLGTLANVGIDIYGSGRVNVANTLINAGASVIPALKFGKTISRKTTNALAEETERLSLESGTRVESVIGLGQRVANERALELATKFRTMNQTQRQIVNKLLKEAGGDTPQLIKTLSATLLQEANQATKFTRRQMVKAIRSTIQKEILRVEAPAEITRLANSTISINEALRTGRISKAEATRLVRDQIKRQRIRLAKANAKKRAGQYARPVRVLTKDQIMQSKQIRYYKGLNEIKNTRLSVESVENVASRKLRSQFQYQVNTAKNRNPITKFVNWFGTEKGSKLTQRIQLGSATDSAREAVKTTIKKPQDWLLKKTKPWRDKLDNLGVNALRRSINDKIMVGALQFDSMLVKAYKVIPMDPEGMLNVEMFWIHDGRRGVDYPIRIRTGIPKWQVVDFLKATSKGSYYKKHIALSVNGQDLLSRSLIGATAMEWIPQLTPARNLYSIATNLKAVGKNIAKGEIPVASSVWRKDFWNGYKRNLIRRGSRIIGLAFGGSYGGKIASGVARGLTNSQGNWAQTSRSRTTIAERLGNEFAKASINEARSRASSAMGMFSGGRVKSYYQKYRAIKREVQTHRRAISLVNFSTRSKKQKKPRTKKYW